MDAPLQLSRTYSKSYLWWVFLPHSDFSLCNFTWPAWDLVGRYSSLLVHCLSYLTMNLNVLLIVVALTGLSLVPSRNRCLFTGMIENRAQHPVSKRCIGAALSQKPSLMPIFFAGSSSPGCLCKSLWCLSCTGSLLRIIAGPNSQSVGLRNLPCSYTCMHGDVHVYICQTLSFGHFPEAFQLPICVSWLLHMDDQDKFKSTLRHHFLSLSLSYWLLLLVRGSGSSS